MEQTTVSCHTAKLAADGINDFPCLKTASFKFSRLCLLSVVMCDAHGND